MSRQSLSKKERTPFFLYVDEFQNVVTETFSDILSEARKYWLWLIVAHQFVRQISDDISAAIFGNIWTLISFRISSEDANYMQQHFSPYVDAFDLAHLDMREFYCKMLTNGQVKNPFSCKTLYSPDTFINRERTNELYELSREKYSRTREQSMSDINEAKDVLDAIEEFIEPIL